MLCVVKFSEDQLWYRAEVVDVVGPGLVHVRYVDYGNSETVSVWQLRKLIDSFLVLPVQVEPQCLRNCLLYCFHQLFFTQYLFFLFILLL